MTGLAGEPVSPCSRCGEGLARVSLRCCCAWLPHSFLSSAPMSSGFTPCGRPLEICHGGRTGPRSSFRWLPSWLRGGQGCLLELACIWGPQDAGG